MRGSSGWPYQADVGSCTKPQVPAHLRLSLYSSSEFIIERSYSEWPFKKAACHLSSSSKPERLKLNGIHTTLSLQLINCMFDLIFCTFTLIPWNIINKGEVCNFFNKWNCFWNDSHTLLLVQWKVKYPYTRMFYSNIPENIPVCDFAFKSKWNHI